jgi:2-polyprenyl-6-hydroxyphenyl methylase/3-demethylubiquinone-9 3-methyltransferase
MADDARIRPFDHSSHQPFFEYYSRRSQTKEEIARFRSIRDCVLRVARRSRAVTSPLEVADVGCGAGTQCIVWAESGHHAHGLDVNEPLLDLARQRAKEAGQEIGFHLGSATALPWADASMDVCLVLELLEHVADWKTCLIEFGRILRPGGILFLTTSNWLCPIQHEFNLPLYSWYPGFLKRRVERLASTTRPELANHATYPAVNWFSFFYLRQVLTNAGFQCLDRFDVMDLSNKGKLARLIVSAARVAPPLRWLAHVATPGTTIVARKIEGAVQ